MKQILQIFLFIYLLSIAFVINSQSYVLSSKNKKALKSYKEAESSFRSFDYSSSLQQLNKTVKKDKNFIEAWLLMGDVFTELDQNKNAINAFNRSIQIDSTFFPRAYFFIGNLAFEEGDYALSAQYLKRYLQFEYEQELTKILAKNRLERAQYAMSLIQHPLDVEPINLGKQINSISDEYINFVNEDFSKLVLTRKTEVGLDIQDRKLFEEMFFQSDSDNGKWLAPEPIKLSWREGLNVGGMNLSVDGRKMYFTGCNWPDGFGSCDLFVSFRIGDSWESPSNLGSNINSQWWESQPAVSSDRKRIYFSSKRSGGKGGSDIWMTIKLENNKWSPPVNLSDSINTPGNEMSPFLHADGNTLYFSSDGHYGLGGSDLFMSQRDELGRWSKANNLGYPINTGYNEINLFMSIDGSLAYLSSDRTEGQGGFDIYQFYTNNEIKPDRVYFVKGIVVDKHTLKPLKAKVELTYLSNGMIADESYSDLKTGEFLMVLHPAEEYAFNISKSGYLFLSEHFSTPESDTSLSVDKIFEMEAVLAGNRLILNNVFFDFDQSELKSKSYNELEKLYQLLTDNEKIGIQIGGHTDNVGDEVYNQKLSEDRAKVVLQYLVNKGISSERLDYKGFGSSRPVADNNTEAGRAQNRRTEVQILDK